MTEPTTAATLTPVEAVRAARDVIQFDLLVPLTPHLRRFGHKLTAHAFIELTGSICAAVVDDDPDSRAGLLAMLDDLRQHVARTTVADAVRS